MNCKPGDMAISVNTRWPENLGVIVTVLRRHVDSPEWNFGGKPAWWCVSTSLMTWHFERSGRMVRDYEGPVPDVNLRPIRPAPQTGQMAKEARELDREALLELELA